MLGKLCAVYGWTLSRLMAEAETQLVSFVAAPQQATWTDPETGYSRRMISPPGERFRGEMVEVMVPAGASVSFADAPVPGLEHHLWMLEGQLLVEVEGGTYPLDVGDSLRYLLTGPSRFQATGSVDARYVVMVVRP
jgi:quercetin dioxygenase-like cupin family protein